jgi:hypothetical protein
MIVIASKPHDMPSIYCQPIHSIFFMNSSERGFQPTPSSPSTDSIWRYPLGHKVSQHGLLIFLASIKTTVHLTLSSNAEYLNCCQYFKHRQRFGVLWGALGGCLTSALQTLHHLLQGSRSGSHSYQCRKNKLTLHVSCVHGQDLPYIHKWTLGFAACHTDIKHVPRQKTSQQKDL